MTFIACRPKIALMCVIRGVARIASGRLRDLVYVLLSMTEVTAQLFMSAGKWEMRLPAMIEAPQIPPIRIVAGAAIRAQAPLVMRVLMTGGTLG